LAGGPHRPHTPGLWISSPARTILEVAATASRDEVAEVVNEGHGLRLFNPRELEAVLHRNRGRRGVAKLAEVLCDQDATSITRSQAQRAFRKLIRDARLPPRRSTSRSGGTCRTSCGASSD
jgi:hypothetical protein